MRIHEKKNPNGIRKLKTCRSIKDGQPDSLKLYTARMYAAAARGIIFPRKSPAGEDNI